MTANVTRAIASVILAILFAALLWWSGSNMASIIELSASVAPEGAVRGFVLVLTILAIGPVSVYLAELIPGVESFVLATLFGIAGQQLLLSYTSSADALFVVVNMALAVVLLHAGLETSWSNFKKLWGVITLLSTLGVVITAVGMSLSVVVIGKWFGVEVLQTVALLLGVYVASTDPAALLELFKRLKLMDKTAGVVVVSESAVNDVMGATLALKLTTLVGGLTTVAGFSLLKDGYMAVLTVDSLWGIAWEMFKGTVLGWIGYQFLIRFEKFLMSRPNPHGVDSVAVKVAGLVVFGFAYATHSGPFLAVFVMGLLFTSTGHVMEGAKDQAHIQNGLKAKDEVDVMAEAEKAGNDKIDGILKPLVFCTLGAIVDIEMLWDYAPVSFALFIAFMLVRFITVVICVSPSVFRSSRQRALALGRGEEVDSVADVTIRDMLFMASVRETGIVPAALLVGAQVAGIGGASTLIALGMGIILCTLVVCPIYKPWLAKKLGLVEEEKTTTTKQSGRYPPGH